MRSFFISLVLVVFSASAHADICLKEFKNDSLVPYEGMMRGKIVGAQGAIIRSMDGKCRIVLEEAGNTRYFDFPYKFRVWQEWGLGLDPFAHFDPSEHKRALLAEIYYDEVGEVKIHVDRGGAVHVKAKGDSTVVAYPGEPAHRHQVGKPDRLLRAILDVLNN